LLELNAITPAQDLAAQSQTNTSIARVLLCLAHCGLIVSVKKIERTFDVIEDQIMIILRIFQYPFNTSTGIDSTRIASIFNMCGFARIFLVFAGNKQYERKLKK
tara:strand:- start:164 stop:475 length:312 start_codon:yes stop_codon:yes gene_type:complete